MRCDDAMHELDLPLADRDEERLANHLSRCESCARQAENAARLNRLWEATRPADPSPQAWDQVWTTVAARLDASQSAASLLTPAERDSAAAAAPRSRPWRGLVAMGLVGLAQAAALLFAVNLYWNSQTGISPHPAPGAFQGSRVVDQPATLQGRESVVEVEAGQVVLIRSDGPQVEILDLALSETPDGEDPWYVFFNRVESASTVVAMTE